MGRGVGRRELQRPGESRRQPEVAQVSQGTSAGFSHQSWSAGLHPLPLLSDSFPMRNILHRTQGWGFVSSSLQMCVSEVTSHHPRSGRATCGH